MKEELKNENKDHLATISKVMALDAQNVKLARQQKDALKAKEEFDRSRHELREEFNRLKVVQNKDFQEVEKVKVQSMVVLDLF